MRAAPPRILPLPRTLPTQDLFNAIWNPPPSCTKTVFVPGQGTICLDPTVQAEAVQAMRRKGSKGWWKSMRENNKGDKGKRGDRGPDGDPGEDDGPAGPQGPKGAQGSKGPTGATLAEVEDAFWQKAVDISDMAAMDAISGSSISLLNLAKKMCHQGHHYLCDSEAIRSAANEVASYYASSNPRFAAFINHTDWSPTWHPNQPGSEAKTIREQMKIFKGLKGSKGPDGPKGDKGESTGMQGPRGGSGETGDRGPPAPGSMSMHEVMEYASKGDAALLQKAIAAADEEVIAFGDEIEAKRISEEEEAKRKQQIHDMYEHALKQQTARRNAEAFKAMDHSEYCVGECDWTDPEIKEGETYNYYELTAKHMKRNWDYVSHGCLVRSPSQCCNDKGYCPTCNDPNRRPDERICQGDRPSVPRQSTGATAGTWG